MNQEVNEILADIATLQRQLRTPLDHEQVVLLQLDLAHLRQKLAEMENRNGH